MGGETTRGRGRRPTGTTGKFVQRTRGTILDLEPELAQRPPVSITLRAVLTGADQGRAAARRGPDDGQVESRRRTWPGMPPVRAIRSRLPITSKPALRIDAHAQVNRDLILVVGQPASWANRRRGQPASWSNR